ncbi:hypothetical protein [Neomoorella thermoacetica]|nr:hypothetical protein [Moorella thermoacetica]
MMAMFKRFKELCKIEPELWELYQEAKSYKPTPDFCANWVWYCRGGLKERLLPLVGWLASNPALRTSEAYDLAYHTIYNALPDCQHEEENIYCF